ncbi:MAG TPA: helix-turn-helix transcriptional regulator [Streptosporangiaceae bacterium]|nr:helix-turn-helix transcriptional regulator [Streptosporangiaceae bacterium]
MRESQTPGPGVLRIRLGVKLRRLRESRGITAQQAAKAIRGSDSKISRIELGRHAAREIDVSDLLTLYGVTDPDEREALLGLASQALAPPWWQRNADILPPWFQAYLGVEEVAESVQSYDTHFVPGLLQTSAYAAGLLARADFAADEAARLLQVRAERVERFAAGGWRLDAVIDEAVLHRPVGPQADFAAQLEQLRDAAGWPGVTVRIRPLTAGAPLSPAGFTILRFAGSELPDAVYTEQLTSASYLDRPADVARYAAAMEMLRESSRPASQTAASIDTVLAEPG